MKYLSVGILRDYAFRKWPANWKNSECGLFERQIQGENRGKSRRRLGDINLVSYHLSRFLSLLWKFTIAFYFLRFFKCDDKNGNFLNEVLRDACRFIIMFLHSVVQSTLRIKTIFFFLCHSWTDIIAVVSCKFYCAIILNKMKIWSKILYYSSEVICQSVVKIF